MCILHLGEQCCVITLSGIKKKVCCFNNKYLLNHHTVTCLVQRSIMVACVSTEMVSGFRSPGDSLKNNMRSKLIL